MLLDEVLPPHASSAANARALVRAALETAAAEEWADSAQLAVSEVVTNSLVHAGTSVRLNIRVNATGLRVEVGDGSPHLPVRRDYSLASGTGRGLHLVTGLVDDWGSFTHDDGKIVWFEIGPGVEQTGQGSRDVLNGVGGPSDDTVAVELRQFPLLMHLAWQEHASALLREFLLVNLDEDEVASFERHAQASDAMNLLYEQVPAPELGEDPDAIMSMATEPGVSAPRLVLSVPRASVPSFDTLEAMLTEAGDLAASGKLLVPPTQPEVREMRRWLCEQVRVQSVAGAEPEPWVLPEISAAREVRFPGPQVDLREFSESGRAVLATDDGSVVVAVSPSAAALLGYRSGEDLVGQPITRIVPHRYHQAHIAGTTLHMVNGRAPLLGVRVRVPVVTADGSEAVVALVVEPRLLQDGHRMFVAEFFPD